MDASPPHGLFLGLPATGPAAPFLRPGPCPLPSGSKGLSYTGALSAVRHPRISYQTQEYMDQCRPTGLIQWSYPAEMEIRSRYLQTKARRAQPKPRPQGECRARRWDVEVNVRCL